ncbi:hypothetical protein [Caballeronia sp. BR00000012568055]|uniref:hypothetical protein n=1 Tax=Caballeronia sp. BR00000012568055 TaxID=2918761 RepID=UPI0023F87543|nr:hypothetical protein [Caballeronia sp. BR00000012568055]
MSRQNLTQKAADVAPRATVQRDAIRVLTDDHRAVQKLLMLVTTQCVCINRFSPFLRKGRQERVFAFV